MDLFIETPRRAAERANMLSEAQRSAANMEDMLYACSDQPADSVGACVREAAAPKAPVLDLDEPDGLESREQAYGKELAYDARRSRLQKVGRFVRTVAFVVAVPVVMVLTFFVSYVATLIVNGATPDQVVSALQALVAGIEQYIGAVLHA